MNGFTATAVLNDGMDFSGMTVTARADMFGQGGNEVITGTESRDDIYGLAGNDILNGGAGGDYLYGGDDLDTINGGTGNDRLYGGNGVDTINGGANDDYIYGEEGADILNGGDNNDDFWVQGTEALGDAVDGGSGYDEIQLLADSFFNLATTFTNMERFDMNGFNATAVLNDGMDFSGMTVTARGDLLGQGGNETITGTESRDDIYGLAGNDTLNGGGGGDYIYGGDGNDIIDGGAGTGTDYLYGDAGTDTISGGQSTDYIYGGADADIINAGDGNDDMYISGTEGIGDTYDGGVGSDDLSLQTDVTLDLTTTFTNMELVRFNGFNITAVSGTGFDLSDMTRTGTGELYGAAGAEVITGTAGTDRIYGYAGTDTLNGFVGSDFIYGGDDADIINGGDGNDTIRGEAGADILNGDDGADNFYISGTDGIGDTYDGGAGSDDLYLESNVEIGNSTTFTNMERVVFAGFSITATLNEGFDLSGMTRSGTANLYGQGGTETILGTESDDNIYGLEGADILTGNAGNDNFYVSGTEALGDVYDGGAGTDDELIMGADTQFNSANSFTSIEQIQFGGFDILITSGSTIDFTGIDRSDTGTIIAAAGNETITGMDNADTIYGLAGADIINSSGGSDTVYGGEGADTINGGAGFDNFYVGGTEWIGDTYDGGADNDDFYLTSDVTYNNTTTFTSMERVVFGGFRITVESGQTLDLTGLTASGVGLLYGSAGDETISGTESGDDIYAGDGVDTIDGNAGNDDIFVSGTGFLGDVIDGGTGTDYVRLLANSTAGTANTFTNIQAIIFNGFDLNLDAGATLDLSGMNKSGAGSVVGTASAETIIGFENADVIRAGGGADIMTTGLGNDSVYVSGTDSLGDVYNGGGGTDYYRLEADSFINSANVFIDVETIIFNGFNLIVDTGATVDLSNMTRSGGGQIHGSAGDENITSVITSTVIYGFAGNDTLRGNIGNDDIYGGIGNDILYGGDGLDDLYGEGGSDIFVLENATAFNDVERIRDLSVADSDALDITDLLSGYTFGVDDLTDFVQMIDSGANTRVFVDTTGTGSFVGNEVAFLYAVNGLTDEVAQETAGLLITH